MTTSAPPVEIDKAKDAAPTPKLTTGQRFGAIVLCAAGFAMLVTGRTAKYMMKKSLAPASNPRNKLRLKDLQPGSDRAPDFLSNHNFSMYESLAARSMATGQDGKMPSFGKFMMASLSPSGDDPEPEPKSHAPVNEEEDFNIFAYATKAFATATLIVAGVFGTAGLALSHYWEFNDMASFKIAVNEHAPRLLRSMIPEQYRAKLTPLPDAISTEQLEAAYQSGGIRELVRQVQKQEETTP